ncbi:MAG: hypothetical protein HYY37_00335 [Candidatus Aenigmarchaeota archaeon]|nr:hypothetical protein [Candidatus Aenigmarchaeota archaeon]
MPIVSRLVLTPVDTHELHAHGMYIRGEEIRLRRDEKAELFGRNVRQGDVISIEYKLNGTAAAVAYHISSAEPPYGHVGRKTTVVIEGERHEGRAEAMRAYETPSSLLAFAIDAEVRGLKNDPHADVPFEPESARGGHQNPYRQREPLIDVMEENNGVRIVVEAPPRSVRRLTYAFKRDALVLVIGGVPYTVDMPPLENPVITEESRNPASGIVSLRLENRQ